ncbi:MAG: type II toxin-antitoxin system VapC family toxin [Candidatus Marinimicrobia bacterium]|nr:type II toxin-antitoxin system VapC family toxin [Candidatus Neomarinimicrobiota bacterium]
MKKKLRIYIDTSVIGGCYDDEFNIWSNQLIQEFKIGLHSPVISEITQVEIIKAPNEVKSILLKLMDYDCELISETEESIELAQKYIEAGILSENFEYDARHIAVATISNVDMLVSWNFRHIVHFDKIRQFNSVNMREGYKAIEILFTKRGY